MSRPFSTTRPPIRLASRGVSRMIDKALTLLPEPDSPTNATVSPGATENETPCTTSRHAPSRRNAVVRFWTFEDGGGHPGPLSVRGRCARSPPPPCSARSPSPALRGRIAAVLLPPPAEEGDHAQRGGGGTSGCKRRGVRRAHRGLWMPRTGLVMRIRSLVRDRCARSAPSTMLRTVPPPPLREGGLPQSFLLRLRRRGTARSVVEAARAAANDAACVERIAVCGCQGRDWSCGSAL